MPIKNPAKHFTPHIAEAWRRAGLEEKSISFRPFDLSQTYPTSSMPALQATKCAQLQGEEMFQRFHIALFKAFFEESRNISGREVLVSLAKKAGLDIKRFSSNFDQGSQKNEVLAEYDDMRVKYEGWGIPLVIFGDRYPIVGACPVAMYRRVADLCLAGQTD